MAPGGWWCRGRCRAARRGGEYPRAAVACRALADYLRRLATKNWVCHCPMEVVPSAVADGIIDGHRRQVGIDGCTACNLGTPAMTDIGILTPGG